MLKLSPETTLTSCKSLIISPHRLLLDDSIRNLSMSSWRFQNPTKFLSHGTQFFQKLPFISFRPILFQKNYSYLNNAWKPIFHVLSRNKNFKTTKLCKHQYTKSHRTILQLRGYGLLIYYLLTLKLSLLSQIKWIHLSTFIIIFWYFCLQLKNTGNCWHELFYVCSVQTSFNLHHQ